MITIKQFFSSFNSGYDPSTSHHSYVNTWHHIGINIASEFLASPLYFVREGMYNFKIIMLKKQLKKIMNMYYACLLPLTFINRQNMNPMF